MESVEIDSGFQAEIADRDAADEKTRKPYIRVTYEMSGTWVILGSIEEYAEDSSELGHVVFELMRDIDGDADRLIVALVFLTDREAANLPEFPGW